MSKQNNINFPKIEYYSLDEATKALGFRNKNLLIRYAQEQKLELCVSCSYLNTRHLDPEKESISRIFPNTDFFNKHFEFSDTNFFPFSFEKIKRVIISSSKNENIVLLKPENSFQWEIWNKENYNFFLVIPISELFKVERNHSEITLRTVSFPRDAEYAVEDVNDGTLYKGPLPSITFSEGIALSIEKNLFVMAEEIERFKNLYQENQIKNIQKYKLKKELQDVAILQILKAKGYDPLNIPNSPKRGMRGVRNEVQIDALKMPEVFTKSTFHKAWQRFLNNVKIEKNKCVP